MLKPIATRILQHIINQNNWSREHLIPFAGKVLQFDFVLIKPSLIILEDGSLSFAGETVGADAVIHLPPSLTLRLLANDDAAKMQIKIDGDTHLATQVSKVLQKLRWDIEDDMSHLVGDIAASKISKSSRKVLQTVKKQSIDITEMVSEYWQEEIKILAKKHQVERFITDVDVLRSDTARFEKRLQKLSLSYAKNTDTKIIESNL